LASISVSLQAKESPPWTASEHSICPVARTCILGEGAKHRDELAQFQSNLLTKNTDLTEQIHTLSQTMSTLTQEVHEATCKGDTSPG
jgi:light-regulated signal transduction histidine kinase (bacteriophytochrome)